MDADILTSLRMFGLTIERTEYVSRQLDGACPRSNQPKLYLLLSYSCLGCQWLTCHPLQSSFRTHVGGESFSEPTDASLSRDRAIQA